MSEILIERRQTIDYVIKPKIEVRRTQYRRTKIWNVYLNVIEIMRYLRKQLSKV